MQARITTTALCMSFVIRMSRLSSTPITHGLAYEAARERASAAYGRAFLGYVEARRSGEPEAVIAARLDEARAAHASLSCLRPSLGE